jgi:hypothetical protein
VASSTVTYLSSLLHTSTFFLKKCRDKCLILRTGISAASSAFPVHFSACRIRCVVRVPWPLVTYIEGSRVNAKWTSYRNIHTYSRHCLLWWTQCECVHINDRLSTVQARNTCQLLMTAHIITWSL